MNSKIKSKMEKGKKYIIVMLTLCIVFGQTMSVFAGQSMEKIDKDIMETKNSFNVDADDLKISIPKNGSEAISIDGEAFGTIERRLPAEVCDAKGIMTENGAVVFNSNNDSMSVSVQNIKEVQNGMEFDAIQSVVTLKNENAPKCLTYSYNLPDGYRLVKDYDYGVEKGEKATGAIYVVNSENETVNVIETMPAVDAKGAKVDVDYIIDGSDLTLKINPDANAVYPIAVPLTEHPDRIQTSYMTKSQVLEVRNRFETDDEENAFSFLITKVLGLLPYVDIALNAWDIISFMGEQYNTKQLTTWDKIYIEFQKNYAKIDARFKWHQGQRGYHPVGALNCTYVYSMS